MAVKLDEGENIMTDKIFLLSIGEYDKYKVNIPFMGSCWWWLRTQGNYSDFSTFVRSDGSVNYCGFDIDDTYGAVRPALTIPEDYKIGKRVLAYDFPWIVIGKGLAIAETPIGFHRFDGKSNNYKNSEIRQWLLNWIEERK